MYYGRMEKGKKYNIFLRYIDAAYSPVAQYGLRTIILLTN
jgi:hypothetical protein